MLNENLFDNLNKGTKQKWRWNIIAHDCANINDDDTCPVEIRFCYARFDINIDIKKKHEPEEAGGNTKSRSQYRIESFVTTDPLLPLISGLNKLPSYKYLDFQLPRPVSLSLSLCF